MEKKNSPTDLHLLESLNKSGKWLKTNEEEILRGKSLRTRVIAGKQLNNHVCSASQTLS